MSNMDITHILFIKILQKHSSKVLVYDKNFKKLHFIFITIYPYISVYVCVCAIPIKITNMLNQLLEVTTQLQNSGCIC